MSSLHPDLLVGVSSGVFRLARAIKNLITLAPMPGIPPKLMLSEGRWKLLPSSACLCF